MPKITPTTDEQHDLLVLVSVMTELEQVCSDKIRPMLQADPLEIESLRQLAIEVYQNPVKDPAARAYYQAVFNLLLLLAKYRPLNVFVPTSGHMECPVTRKLIHPSTSILTTEGVYLDYEAIWVNHKKLLPQSPIDHRQFSKEEVGYQKSCIEYIENTRAYSTVAAFLGQVGGVLSFDVPLIMLQQDKESDNATNALLYLSLAFAGAKLGEKVGSMIWDKYCRTSEMVEEKLCVESLKLEQVTHVFSRIKNVKAQSESCEIVIDRSQKENNYSSCPASFFNLLKNAKTIAMTKIHGDQPKFKCRKV